MDPFASYTALDTPQSFWTELDEILDTPFHPPANATSQHLLDAKRIYVANVVAKFLQLCVASFNDNLTSEYNQEYCINRLFASRAFREYADPDANAPETIPMHQLAIEEIIRVMQTSTSIPVLLITYEIVLCYGQAAPSTYKSIQALSTAVSFVGIRAFLHRLVHQIWAGSYAAQAEAKIGISEDPHPVGWNGASWDDDSQSPPESSSAPRRGSYVSRGLTSDSASKDIAIQISLRQKAVRMLYETCRVQKLEPAHLKAFDERFIHHLFDLVEETRFHHDEDFNYRLIKLLVAMNEQYMVSTLTSHASTASASGNGDQANSSAPTTAPVNLVLSVLQQRLNASKTFGENLIFMLNRASSSDAEDVCMQLLVLKLLYLLFTTKKTACYFYTNDLRVLVDIFIRELQDLPDESESLRHTYLRVLHPLLTNTQLCTYPYKRPQIRRVLNALLAHGHLRHISATTTRLVERCLRAEWCVELDRLDGTQRTGVAKVEPIGGGEMHEKRMEARMTNEGLPMLATQINERSSAVMATADSLAATSTQDHQLFSPAVVSRTNLSFALPSHTQAGGGGSLSVPGTMRTRDKRVASLSHPRSPKDADKLLRPSSAASLGKLGGKAARRAVSAATASVHSAPCTPPRAASPALNIRPRHSTHIDTHHGSSLPEEGEADDAEALSTSSSGIWHVQVVETEALPPSLTSPAPRTRSEVKVVLGSQLVVPDNSTMPASAVRMSSPLSYESTIQVLDASALAAVGEHAKEGSDHTVTLGGELMVKGNSTTGCEAPKRRKPPQPPAQRRTMPSGALSSSSPSLSHSHSHSEAGSRADSPYEGSQGSCEDVAKTATGMGGRRRPPPPPPSLIVPSTNKEEPVAGQGGDGVESAQNFYIAERLRRGLRIR